MSFSSERDRAFGHTLGLGKEGGTPKRLSNKRGKLHLKDLGLWWSMGEGGEGDDFSSLPWKM